MNNIPSFSDITNFIYEFAEDMAFGYLDDPTIEDFAKPENNNKIIEPTEIKVVVGEEIVEKEGRIIGSKLNHEFCKNSYSKDIFKITEGYQVQEFLYPKDTLHLKGEFLFLGNSTYSAPVNYTQHKMTYYTRDNLTGASLCLDGYIIRNHSDSLHVRIMPIKNRADLLCIQKGKVLEKLIVLEKTNDKKNFIISWEADPKAFGVPVENQPYNFEFSIEKIDLVTFRKNIGLFLFLANQNDGNSPLANLPKELIPIIAEYFHNL